MAAFCLFSLYYWPESLRLDWLQYLIAMSIIGYFGYKVFHLKHFKLAFALHSEHRFKYSNDAADYLCRVLWVSPLLCAFYVLPVDEPETKRQKRLIIIWRDMLSDSNYRHLSRLLITN